MEKIEQRHREMAVEHLRQPHGRWPSDVPQGVLDRILAGLADEHPAVQAAAFYEKHPQ